MKNSKLLNFRAVFLSGKFLSRFVSVCGIIFSIQAGAQSSVGTLVVRGEAGPSQIFRQVKAARCSVSVRSCATVEYFDLNQEKTLPAGQYIVGFENSLYPGWVVIRPGERKELNLVKLQAPTNLRNEAKVRVFRDFDADIEKNKIFFVQFYMGRPLFRLSEYNFGDLYLASPGMSDVTLRLNYDICNSFKIRDAENEEAVSVCLYAAQARGWRDMSPLFQFTGRDYMKRDLMKGQYVQKLVSEAGDRRQIVMRRQLVSAPMRGADFVSVFPGQYRFLSDSPSATSQSVKAGAQVENFD